MFNKGDTYQVTADDGVTCAYHVTDVGDDKVTFCSLQTGYTVTWPPSMVKRFMEVIGAKLVERPVRYRVYWINHQYYSQGEHQSFDSAVKAGKEAGFEFRVELGEMVCATWSLLGGLRVMSEYQRWATDQQMELARVSGEWACVNGHTGQN